jgi:hypothetical protein
MKPAIAHICMSQACSDVDCDCTAAQRPGLGGPTKEHPPSAHAHLVDHGRWHRGQSEPPQRNDLLPFERWHSSCSWYIARSGHFPNIRHMRVFPDLKALCRNLSYCLDSAERQGFIPYLLMTILQRRWKATGNGPNVGNTCSGQKSDS